jgi:hypothetical protein
MIMIVVALIAGLVFGVGLTISRMVDPAKVLGFLDIAGAWDPSLILVMAGAIMVAFPAFFVIQRRGHDMRGRGVALPPRWPLDWRLVTGSIVFGAGWGLVGFCPGPALASLGLGSARSLVFIAAMLIGMLAVDLANRQLGARRGAPLIDAQPSGQRLIDRFLKFEEKR